MLARSGFQQLPLMLLRAKPYAERLFTYKTIAASRSPLRLPGADHPLLPLPFHLLQTRLYLVLYRTQRYPYFLQQSGELLWNEAEFPLIV